LREARAKVVVEVARDAGTFLFHFALPLKAIEPAAVSLALD
jgi:hypothetical protein